MLPMIFAACAAVSWNLPKPWRRRKNRGRLEAPGAGAVVSAGPALGVPGFPHCVRQRPTLNMTVEQAADDLMCSPTPALPSAISIACVGDSITEGFLSPDGNYTYPGQFQILLGRDHGEGACSVTSLGAGGATRRGIRELLCSFPHRRAGYVEGARPQRMPRSTISIRHYKS